MPSNDLIAKSQNEAWIAKKADHAKKDGSIRTNYLVCMMANDKEYVPLLYNYWTKFQINKNAGKCPDPSSFNERINIWAALFQRWTYNEAIGISPLKEDYEFDIISDPLALDETTSDIKTIKLNHLEQFFVRWNILLPTCLFPVQPGNKERSDHKHTPPNDSAIILGKSGAQKRWGPYHELMDKACKRADEKWEKGDNAWHNEMATWLLGKAEFMDLKTYRSALLKKLGPVAEKYGRKRGVKPTKKEKK
jgi:hypothetical protein